MSQPSESISPDPGEKAGWSEPRFGAMVCFLGLSFALSWGIMVPAALARYGVAIVRASRGLQTMAQFAPAVAATVTVSLYYGLKSVPRLLRRLTRVRAPLKWYLFAVFLAPISQAAAVLIYRFLGFPLPSFAPWKEAAAMGAILTIFSAGEELGWRGFFLPGLMRSRSLLASTGWIALFWGLWHLPFYLANDSEGSSTVFLYLIFLLGIYPVSAFLVLIYARTRSVFLCMIFHGSLNAGAAYWFGPMPRGQLLPFAVWVLVIWLAAVPILRGSDFRNRQPG